MYSMKKMFAQKFKEIKEMVERGEVRRRSRGKHRNSKVKQS